jgi:hypothetical protein
MCAFGNCLAMRVRLSLLLLLIGLAGCSSSPSALGLTGAQPRQPPAAPDDSVLAMPGLPQPGGGVVTGYGSASGGSQGRYYGTP